MSEQVAPEPPLSGDALTESEALTGVELLHYLTESNAKQLESVKEKQGRYAELQSTLHTLLERSHHPVMAPVANGLAYFDAEIRYTNNVLVLLGDSWFVERSVKQAVEIATRRLEFLRREEKVLTVESEQLAMRRDLLFAEEPQAAAQSRSEQSTPSASSPAVAASAVPKSGAEKHAEVEHAWLQGLSLAEVAELMTKEELAVIDEMDDLTEEELIAIEHEVGDRIEDDEFVERVMMDKILEKKAKRVRAEMEQRRRDMTRPPEATGSAPSTGTSPSPAPVVSFRTPGDISKAAQAASGGAQEASSSPHAVQAPQPVARKRVHFSPDIAEVEARERTHGEDQHHGSPGEIITASSSHSQSQLGVDVVDASVGVHRGNRHCVLGDVKETEDLSVAGPVSLLPARSTAPVVRPGPSKKSLFRRVMEGGEV